MQRWFVAGRQKQGVNVLFSPQNLPKKQLHTRVFRMNNFLQVTFTRPAQTSLRLRPARRRHRSNANVTREHGA